MIVGGPSADCDSGLEVAGFTARLERRGDALVPISRFSGGQRGSRVSLLLLRFGGDGLDSTGDAGSAPTSRRTLCASFAAVEDHPAYEDMSLKVLSTSGGLSTRDASLIDADARRVPLVEAVLMFMQYRFLLLSLGVDRVLPQVRNERAEMRKVGPRIRSTHSQKFTSTSFERSPRYKVEDKALNLDTLRESQW